LINLDAQIHLEAGEFLNLLLERTNQHLKVMAKIIGYLQHITKK